jgi:hypothetical protein
MSLANDPTYAPAVYYVALSDQVNFDRLEAAEAAYQQVWHHCSSVHCATSLSIYLSIYLSDDP